MKQIATVFIAALLVLPACMIAAGSAKAEMLVLESDVPDLPAGAKFADGKTISVPEDKTLRVLAVTNGSTKTLKGPYHGTVGAYTEKRSWWERLTGKTKDGDAPVGAVRGMRAPPPN